MNINPVNVTRSTKPDEEGLFAFKMCPFRIAVQTHRAIAIGNNDVTVQDFLPCLRGECAAYYNRGNYHHTCLRLNEILQKEG